MRHPATRGERRAVREQHVARRKSICLNTWRGYAEPWHEGKPEYQRNWEPFNEWGRYSKWNLNCGSKMCHGAKYYKCKDKRRKALKSSESTAEFRRRDKAAGKL